MTHAMTTMPKYERYKDSGFEPIGDIPEHWELLANRHIFRLKKSQVGKNSDQYDLLSLTLKGVIKRDMENPEGKFPAEFDTYQPIKPGDFIFCLFDVEETPRTVGISPFNGMITGAYTTFKASPEINHEYLHYLYYFLDKHKMLRPLYRGLRNTIPKENFYAFKSCLPPREEQDKIVAFLDEKTVQIDEAIGIKEQQIALLKERKQIIIQNAVTKGLNPSAPLKDSGVDWIGDIPAHWDVKPLMSETELKSVTNCADRELLSVYLDLGVIRFSDVDQKRTNATSLDLSGYQAVDPGDFVLNNQQAWRGSVGVSKYTGIISPAYIVLTLSDKFDIDYANYLLRSSVMVAHYLMASKGVGTIQRNLYWQHVKRMPVFIPPMKEQQEIVSYISEKTSEIDLAINSQEKQINNLKEYKASLINSAVTGKIKVI